MSYKTEWGDIPLYHAKKPCESYSDLLKRYPTGADYGDYALVVEEGIFYYYTDRWQPIWGAASRFKGWFNVNPNTINWYPYPKDGDYVYVRTTAGVLVWEYRSGLWVNTGIAIDHIIFTGLEVGFDMTEGRLYIKGSTGGDSGGGDVPSPPPGPTPPSKINIYPTSITTLQGKVTTIEVISEESWVATQISY